LKLNLIPKELKILPLLKKREKFVLLNKNNKFLFWDEISYFWRESYSKRKKEKICYSYSEYAVKKKRNLLPLHIMEANFK